MFATDRDLLVLEPRLFHDISWSAQKLVDSASGGVIDTAGTKLTVSSIDFAGLGVGGGSVVLLGATTPTPIEVLSRLSATELSVSRLRASTSDAAVPVTPASGQKVVVHSFRPQLSLVHAQLLRMVGIEPDDAAPPADQPVEADITNPRAFVLAEALGALHLIFSSAAALVGSDSPLWVKATMYAERFRAERTRLQAELDLDGDGEPDAVRRPNVVQFVRG